MEKFIAVIGKLLGAYLNVIALFAPKLAGKYAFLIFCYPFAAKLKPHQEKYLSSANRETLEFEKRQIALYTWGNGPTTVLCVHGWQSNSFRWKRFVERMDLEKFKIVAFDAPGHGASTGKILNVPIYGKAIGAVIDHLGQVDALIAHSIGAFSCMHHMYENKGWRPKAMAVLASPGNAEEFVAYFIRMLGASDRLVLRMREYFKEYTGHKVSYYDTTRYGPRLNALGLIVHDTGDQDVPVLHARNLHERWPGSELWITEGLGHDLREPQVVDRVQEFFKSKVPAIPI